MKNEDFCNAEWDKLFEEADNFDDSPYFSPPPPDRMTLDEYHELCKSEVFEDAEE